MVGWVDVCGCVCVCVSERDRERAGNIECSPQCPFKPSCRLRIKRERKRKRILQGKIRIV